MKKQESSEAGFNNALFAPPVIFILQALFFYRLPRPETIILGAIASYPSYLFMRSISRKSNLAYSLLEERKRLALFFANAEHWSASARIKNQQRMLVFYLYYVVMLVSWFVGKHYGKRIAYDLSGFLAVLLAIYLVIDWISHRFPKK